MMSSSLPTADPNVFHHNDTYRGETAIPTHVHIPPPPPPPPSASFVTAQPSSHQIPPASYQPLSTSTEPERCSLYVPCPKTNCNEKPGCEGCVECDKIFTCTREECELPLPHELEQGKF